MINPSQVSIKPNDIPMVAIDFMNHTHYEEVALVNNIAELIKRLQNKALDNDKNTQALTKLLDQWVIHTEMHFANENKLMQKYDFPAYEVHSIEHEISLERIKNSISRWQKTQEITPLSDFIFVFWPAWFKAHLESMDTVTAQYATMKGYKDNQAQAS